MTNKKFSFLKCITIFLQYHFSLIFRFLLHVSWRENMRHEGRKPIWPILESFQHNIYFIIAASRFTLGHQWRTNETGVAKTVCGNKPVLSLKLEEKFISISLSWTIKKNWVQRQNWQNVINPVKPSTHRLLKLFPSQSQTKRGNWFEFLFSRFFVVSQRFENKILS